MSDPNTPVPVTIHGKPSRRQAMQWVMGALAASALPTPFPTPRALAQPVGRTVTPQENAAKQPDPVIPGYGTDPDLLTPHKPGDFWPLTLKAPQKQTVAALADTIIPKDDLGPAASEVGVVEMLDEWISAPYPVQQTDRRAILAGLTWVDAQANQRFGGKAFAALSADQRQAICDDICHAETAKPAFKEAAEFFARFRTICAAAYYATPAGWKAIGYVGNVALPQFDGPPPEVLAKLGVTQTVR